MSGRPRMLADPGCWPTPDAGRPRSPRSLFRGGTHSPAFYDGIVSAVATTGRWRGDMLGRRSDGSLGVLDSQIGKVELWGEPIGQYAIKREAGATRLFGEIKPWAPSFSYGLVIETDERLVPTASAHSRANGRRHAISDAVGWNEDIIAVSRASGELLRIAAGDRVQ